jgi:hypothetical protein
VECRLLAPSFREKLWPRISRYWIRKPSRTPQRPLAKNHPAASSTAIRASYYAETQRNVGISFEELCKFLQLLARFWLFTDLPKYFDV